MSECILFNTPNPVWESRAIPAYIPTLTDNTNVIHSSNYGLNTNQEYKIFNGTGKSAYFSENQVNGYLGYNFGEPSILSSVTITGGWYSQANSRKWKIQVDNGDDNWVDVYDDYMPRTTTEAGTSPTTTLSFPEVICTRFRVLHYYGEKAYATDWFMTHITVE